MPPTRLGTNINAFPPIESEREPRRTSTGVVVHGPALFLSLFLSSLRAPSSFFFLSTIVIAINQDKREATRAANLYGRNGPEIKRNPLCGHTDPHPHGLKSNRSTWLNAVLPTSTLPIGRVRVSPSHSSRVSVSPPRVFVNQYTV